MELLSFRKFNDKETAEALGQLFHDNKILFEIISDAGNLDELYGNSELHNYYHVKIQGADFPRAKQIMITELQSQVDHTATDHYLFEFGDAELLEVIYKADEWSEFDYLLAKRILKERGKQISEEEVQKITAARKLELAKPEEFEVPLTYSKNTLGSIFSAMMAWSIITEKKTLPDGQRVYRYAKASRDRAQSQLILSAILTIFVLLVLGWLGNLVGMSF
jgi:hypothetical protein